MTNTFDVLIPAHGETPRQIETLLYAIFLQETNIVKLNKIFLCSDDRPILTKFANRCSVATIKQNTRMGKPDALNLMLKEIESEFCIQNSADCIPASNLTYHHLLKHLLMDKQNGAVTSRPESCNPGFMYLPNIVWKCHHFVQPKLSGELFAFRRSLLSRLPEAIVHDDAYIHHVVEAQKFKVVYEPKAVVFNSAPNSFGELYAQRKKNVVGNMQMGDRFKLEPPRNMRLRSLILMALELLANVHGRLDYVRGKIPEGLVGYNLQSTKEVIK